MIIRTDVIIHKNCIIIFYTRVFISQDIIVINIMNNNLIMSLAFILNILKIFNYKYKSLYCQEKNVIVSVNLKL